MYARLTDDKTVLYQWDTNQKMEVSEDVDRIDFRYRESRDIVYGVFAKDGLVDIPNVLLQKNGVMDALIMVMQGGIATVETMEITVVERPVPPGYFITKQGTIIGYDEFTNILTEMGAMLADGTTPMKATLDMDGHNIVNLDDPEDYGDAVNKGWADDSYLAKSGGTMTGRLKGLKEPIEDDEPVRKADMDANDDKARGYSSTAEANAKAYAKQYTDQSRIIVLNKAVSKASFVADTTYKDYGYRAAVAISGVTASMIPDVVFPVQDEVAYACVATSYNGGIYIYADKQPSNGITIPTIIVWRGDN